MYKVFEIGTDPFALEQRLNQLASDGYQFKSTLEGHPGVYNAAGIYIEHTWSPSMLIVEKPSDLVAHVLTLINHMTEDERQRLIDSLLDNVTDPVLEAADRAAKLYDNSLLTYNGRRLRYSRGGRA